MSMETEMQTQLAVISQKMMDTLRKDQLEVNTMLRRDLEQMQMKINNVELKHERDVKEMKDSIEEVKQGNVVVKDTLDAMQSDNNQKALTAEAAAKAAAVAAEAVALAA